MNKKEYSQLVGEQLKALRLYKRLSLREVEERCEDLTFSAISKYERGERSISLDCLKDLVENGLGYDLIEFLSDVQDMKHED